MGLHQTKNLCTAEETVNKTKRLLNKWERILANHISDQVLRSKIMKYTTPQQQQKQTAWLKNGHRIWIGFFWRRHTDG